MSPRDFPALRVADLRHQKNGQIRLSLDGAPYGDVANVLARNERAAEWAALFRAAPELLKVLDPEMLEAIADEIGTDFHHSARAASLRHIAAKQREAVALLDKPLTAPSFIERLVAVAKKKESQEP